MRLVEARSVPLLSPGVVKMEERKRPAPHGHEDSASPLKKQATAVNGGGKSHPDAEMPWKDELEVSFVAVPSPITASNPSFPYPSGVMC
jgi:E3 ubiquitin-protein ligase BRE1